MKQDEARLPVLFPVVLLEWLQFPQTRRVTVKHIMAGVLTVPAIPQVISSRCGWSSWNKRTDLTERQRSQQLSAKWGNGWSEHVAKNPGIASPPGPECHPTNSSHFLSEHTRK